MRRRRRRTPQAKAQIIRLADVFIIGPLMMYAAMNRDSGVLPSAARAGLLVFGAGTVIFNGVNYVRFEKGQIRG